MITDSCPAILIENEKLILAEIHNDRDYSLLRFFNPENTSSGRMERRFRLSNLIIFEEYGAGKTKLTTLGDLRVH
jgi:hypothetical protein